ncbi:MAG: DUF3822 family protein [Bacteroidota bacterium]|nr:DUF3822 family protein [Bacteroidota bacterium]
MSKQFYQVLNIADQTFNQQQTARYRLSIRIAADGFSFCLADPDRNMYIQLASFENKTYAGVRRLEKELVDEMFEDVVSLHPWLKGNFASVNILFEDCRFTLLPSDLFDDHNYQTIYNYNFSKSVEEEVFYSTLPILDTVLIYGVPSGLVESFKKRYPIAKFYHGNFPLLTSFVQKYRNEDNQGSVLANFRTGAMDILILHERKLQLLNSYTCKVNEDVLYFLIFAIEQIGLNPETVELYLSGKIEKDSNLLFMIKKYVRNIRLINRNDDFRYSYPFERVEGHQFYNLLNLNLCE